LLEADVFVVGFIRFPPSVRKASLARWVKRSARVASALVVTGVIARLAEARWTDARFAGTRLFFTGRHVLTSWRYVFSLFFFLIKWSWCPIF